MRQRIFSLFLALIAVTARSAAAQNRDGVLGMALTAIRDSVNATDKAGTNPIVLIRDDARLMDRTTTNEAVARIFGTRPFRVADSFPQVADCEGIPRTVEYTCTTRNDAIVLYVKSVVDDTGGTTVKVGVTYSHNKTGRFPGSFDRGYTVLVPEDRNIKARIVGFDLGY